jgi:hypothetical protein
LKIIGRSAAGNLIVEIGLDENDRLAKAVAGVIAACGDIERIFVPDPAAENGQSPIVETGEHRSEVRPSSAKATDGKGPRTEGKQPIAHSLEPKPCVRCGLSFTPNKRRPDATYCKRPECIRFRAAAKQRDTYRAKHNIAGPRAAATKCKRCGAPRATTPWPAKGAVCRECTRKIASERGAKATAEARAAAKPATGMRGVIARSYARAKIARPHAPSAPGPALHGTDRIRAAMDRLDAGDGLPQEGGRTLPIIHD